MEMSYDKKVKLGISLLLSQTKNETCIYINSDQDTYKLCLVQNYKLLGKIDIALRLMNINRILRISLYH